MSEFKVLVTTIQNIKPHPDPETHSLEIVTVFGWEVITKKGLRKEGEKVVYIPIDSILPEVIEDKLFGENAKIKLKNSRVRAVKIRKFVSQGMIATLTELGLDENIKIGTDVKDLLKITKFEPPENPHLTISVVDKKGKKVKIKKCTNPYFKEYGGLNHLKYALNAFEEGESIIVTEKIHGTNSRCGWMPNKPTTFWQKLKKFFGFHDKWQFCYGSNHVQLQSKKYQGFYSTDYYSRAVEEYRLDKIMPKGYILFYEIFGPNIQKNYHYGRKPNDFGVVVFDVVKVEEDGSYEWLNHDDLVIFVDRLNVALGDQPNCERLLRIAPVLYEGPYTGFPAIKALTEGPSVLHPPQAIREGVVVRNYNHQRPYKRKAYKVISDEYLMKDNTDFH